MAVDVCPAAIFLPTTRLRTGDAPSPPVAMDFEVRGEIAFAVERVGAVRALKRFIAFSLFGGLEVFSSSSL